MPTYRQTVQSFPNPRKRFLFVHIPRTAGRFLEENFLDNGFEPEQKIWMSIDGIEIAHFDRSLYERHFDIKGIPHFTVVRNPIDRFFSCSIFLKRMYGDDIQEAMEDEMMFYQMLQNFPLTQAVNWFRPQVDFLTSETNIWKFEDGFGDDFAEWLSDVLGVKFAVNEINPDNVKNINRQKLNLEYLEPDHKSRKLDRSAKLVNNITSLYRQDIETLYPKLAV